MVLLTAVVASMLAVPAPAQAVAEPDLVRNLQWQIPALQLTEVHKRSTGVGMVVAVVDSGVDPLHPDLAGQLLQGPEGSNSDIDGRGTGLAGLVAGHGHGAGRDQGVLGVAPGARILPVAFAPVPFENGEADRMASAIDLAMNRGAQIICLGRGVTPSERLDFAIEVAVEKGILVVAADTAPGSRCPEST
jgi:membrane-anchored mycosin MYCP